MTDKEIFQLAKKFRNAILKANANGEFFRAGFIERFPEGNCGIVCDLLGRYLLEYANVRSWYTSGEIKLENHVWLTLEKKIIVDITGDQYSNRIGSLHYERLKGDLKDFESVRCTGRWRLIFKSSTIDSSLIITDIELIEISNHYGD